MKSHLNGNRPAPTSWVSLATQWQFVATPLRPSPADAAWSQRVIDAVAARVRGLRVLMLGVTPELSTLRYPPDASFVAVDSSPEMLSTVWTPPRGCVSAVVRARWQHLPVAPSSIDLVLADASFCSLPDVRNFREVLAGVVRVMRSGALLCGRTFVSPAVPEKVDDVVRDVIDGRAGSVHATKWRIAMALQAGSTQGVALADVWRVLQQAGDLEELAARNGWSDPAARTLRAYEGVSSRMCFPTLEHTRRLFGEHFDELEFHAPDYELGERCPSLLLRRR